MSTDIVAELSTTTHPYNTAQSLANASTKRATKSLSNLPTDHYSIRTANITT